jgi:DNA topoisomerase-2
MLEQNEYMIKGIYKKIDDETIQITELPIGTWTTPYKEFLEKKLEKTKNSMLIDSYKQNCTDESIDFTIKLNPDLLDKLEKNGQIWSKFKLSKSYKQHNMHLYNADGLIRKYSSTNDILKEFYDIRLITYTKRKEYLIGKLTAELDILKYKKMFIEHVLGESNGKKIEQIIIYKRKKIDIITDLEKFKFPKLSNSNNTTDTDNSYDYLTDMPLFAFTYEKINELNERFNAKEQELIKIQSISEIEQWKIELNELEDAYNKWLIIHSNLDKKPVKILKKNNTTKPRKSGI